MGKHKDKVMSTHWAGCWTEHPDCFWGRCIRLGGIRHTTAEYQAFRYFKAALDSRFHILQRKEVINGKS